MGKIDKKFYEGKALLKPFHKVKNPTGVKNEEVVTVSNAEKMKLPQTGDTWLVTYKEHVDTAMALNKTNAKKMVDLFGDETDDWVGERVKLIVVMAPNPSAGGKETPSLRIKTVDWQYGDDEGEDMPDREPDEPIDSEEEKAAKIQARRKK